MSNGRIQYERKAAGKLILKHICMKTVNSYSKKIFKGDRRGREELNSISSSDISLSFIYPQKTSTSSVCFGENKSFVSHNFARKTKVSSYKLARRAKLPRLFNVSLNFK